MKQLFQPFIINAKIKTVLNSANVFKLSKQEIKERTKQFPKQKVLNYKIKMFKSIIKKSEKNTESHAELKQLAIKLGLRFNREIRNQIKNHWQDIDFFSKPITPINTTKIKLLKDEVCYLELNGGSFTDIPHIFHLDLRKYNNLILTNKRLITIFTKHKNSYYYDSYNFHVYKKIIVLRCNAYKKPTIYLFPKAKQQLIKHLKHILNDRP